MRPPTTTIEVQAKAAPMEVQPWGAGIVYLNRDLVDA
jgi:hypothetical protein